MEVPKTANECAASKIEMTEAAEKRENVGSSSNNQKKDFKLLDSTYFAAADGDITKFQQLEKEVDQILTPNGNTILHIYITARPRRVNEQETETDDFMGGILEMCPDLVWQANKKGETLLHMAARHGHADLAKLLLDECKKPWQNHDQESGIKATRRMLQMASYKAKDTALHEAVRYNYLDVVKILTKEDPSLPYEANTAGETPLYLAAERQHAGVLKAILDLCDSPADGGPYNRTALHMAVFCNNEEMTTLLLAKEGTCVSKLQDEQGWTPLHFAAHFGYTEILKKLLTKDKDAAYTADEEGKTALHVAAAGGKVEIMQELLSTCPGCCELVDKRGWNVLHFASTSQNIKAIRLVLRYPSLRNLVNEKEYENGNTPLLQAAYMGRIKHILSAEISNEVDKLVFNSHNHNAADIVSADKSRLFPSLFSLFLEKNKVSPGMRTRISRTDIGKSKSQEEEAVKEEVNTMSSESENGNNMRAVDKFVSKVVEKNLLAATLIATVSFTAGITVPGGFVSDKEHHKEGTAILTGNLAFRAFVVLNTMSFFLSSFAVIFHLFEPFFSLNTTKHLLGGMLVGHYLTTFATITMMGAFHSGTWAVLRGSDKYLAFISSCTVVGLFLIRVAGYSCFLTMRLTLFKMMPAGTHPVIEKFFLHKLNQ